MNAAECVEAVECINEWNQNFVDVVRKTGGNNATRYLMVPGYDASADGVLNDKFVLPTDTAENEGKILVSVHAYIPYHFALQAATENESIDQFNASEKTSTNDIDQMMEKLYAKYISNEIPVVIGEFGARDKNGNLQSRVDYAAYYIAAARARQGSKPEGAAGTVRRVFLPWDFPWHRLSGSDSDDYFLQTGIGGVRGQGAIPDHGTGGHEQCRGEVSDRDADPHGVLSADRGGSTACRGGISTDPQSAFPVDYGQRAVVCLVSRYNGTCICGYLLCGISDHFKNLLPHCGQSGALNYLWKVTGSTTENTFLSPCRSTVILPEWFVTIECAMDRPSPK